MTRLARTATAGRRAADARIRLDVDGDRTTRRVASLVGAILCSAALAANAAEADDPLKLADSQLEPLQWTALAGWPADDHLAAFAAYQRSCQAMRRMRRTEDRGRIYGALWNVCREADGMRLRDSQTARTFFERNFQPVRIARLGEAGGLLTGYFEPVVQGSRMPSPEFHVPVYRRPPDLVAAGYKPGSRAFPNKGARIGRLNEKNELVPYHDRGAIEAGALDGQKLEICWLKDPLDLLAIQLEGSGRVILEDGTPLRLNYDSHNGYPFSSVSRVLAERKLIPREAMSSQRIRAWMAAHPDEAAKVRAANRSYVFFRITGLTNEGEPVGAQGVPLTPGRSIAVDRRHEYGTPFFIEADLPIESAKPASPFRRLMIAQDTGSAIVGPARADLYWGAGDDAGRIANRIRHSGRFVMLVPRELDMIEAGRHMPLPAPKPKIPAVEVATVGKGKAVESKAPDKGKAPEGKALDKPKTPAVEVATVGKGKAVESKAPDKGKAPEGKALDKPKTPAVEVATVGKGKALESKAPDKGKVLDKPKTPAVEVATVGKGKALESKAPDKGKALDKPKTPAVEVATVGKGKAIESKPLDKGKALESKMPDKSKALDRDKVDSVGSNNDPRVAAKSRRGAAARAAAPAPDCGRRPAPAACARSAGAPASLAASASSRARRAN
jgi:membrane-bound lytic murein transglycosylase A